MTELYESGSGVANAQGKAIVRLQPLRAFEDWHVQRVSIQSTSSTLVPTFKLYKGSETPSSFIGGTFTGNLNSDPQLDLTLMNGESLLGVWEGGDVGSTCTMTITGTKNR